MFLQLGNYCTYYTQDNITQTKLRKDGDKAPSKSKRLNLEQFTTYKHCILKILHGCVTLRRKT